MNTTTQITSSHYATKYIITYAADNMVISTLWVGGVKINSGTTPITPLDAMNRYIKLRNVLPNLPIARIN